MRELQNFIIEDDELICYLGNAADIVIPEGVNRIGMGYLSKTKM